MNWEVARAALAMIMCVLEALDVLEGGKGGAADF